MRNVLHIYNCSARLLLIITILCTSISYGQPTSNIPKPTIHREAFRKLIQQPTSKNIDELVAMPPLEAIPVSLALSSLKGAQDDHYVNLALQLAESGELPKIEAEIRFYRTLQLSDQNNLKSAYEEIKKSVTLFSQYASTNEWYLASLQLKGSVEHRHGRLADSISTYDLLASHSETLKNKYYLAEALQQGGLIRYKLGQKKDVQKKLNQALNLFRELNDQRGIATCLKSLGNCYNSSDQSIKAMQLYQEAADKYQKIMDHHGQANCLYNMGLIHQENKDYDKSIDLLQEASISYTQAGSIGGVGICHMEMGKTYRLMKSYSGAETSLLRAKRELTKRQSHRRLAQTESYLADLYIDLGQQDKAKHHINESIKLYKQLGLESYMKYEFKRLNELKRKPSIKSVQKTPAMP